MAGPEISISSGEVKDVSDDEGKRLIEANYAEEVKSTPRKKVEVVKAVISKSSTKKKKK